MIPNQWYGILPSKELKKGRLLAVRRLGLDLVLFRDASGKPGAVVDQCAHRGVALSHGKLVGDCVQCPFHGIEFRNDGRCRFIPANGRASTADLSRFNVRSYPVREAYGIVFLWFGEAALATDVLPWFPDHIDDGYSYSEMADHWTTHYSRAIENQLDVVHLPFVHHNTIGRGNKTLVHGPKVIVTDLSVQTSANNEVDVGQPQRGPETCTIHDTFIEFRFPNVWMNHISDTIKVMIYFAPVDDANTILYIRFYAKVSRLRFVNAFMAWAGKPMNKVIERQDRRVVVTQRPKPSAYRSAERLIQGDRPIVEYRRRREQLKGGDVSGAD